MDLSQLLDGEGRARGEGAGLGWQWRGLAVDVF